MKYNSILEKLDERIDSLESEQVSMYAIFNRLKDIYIDIIKDGYIEENLYLDLAAFIIYAGFLMEE